MKVFLIILICGIGYFLFISFVSKWLALNDLKALEEEDKEEEKEKP